MWVYKMQRRDRSEIKIGIRERRAFHAQRTVRAGFKFRISPKRRSLLPVTFCADGFRLTCRLGRTRHGGGLHSFSVGNWIDRIKFGDVSAGFPKLPIALHV